MGKVKNILKGIFKKIGAFSKYLLYFSFKRFYFSRKGDHLGSRLSRNSSSVASSIDSGVIEISSTDDAFAALKSDGSVVTWGSSAYGGDSSSVSTALGSGVIEIFSTQRAFAALKSESVVTWGHKIRRR